MATIAATIELEDRMSARLDNIYRCAGVTTNGIDAMSRAIMGMPDIDIGWQNIEGGAKREQQLGSVVQTAQKLAQMQDEITNRSYDTMVLSNNAAEDISNVNDRLVELAMRAEALSNRTTDGATEAEINSINNALGATDAKLKSILGLQNSINSALLAGDMGKVNAGYAQLNNMIKNANGQLNNTEKIYADIDERVNGVNNRLAVGIYKVEAEKQSQTRLNAEISRAESEISDNIKKQEMFNGSLKDGQSVAERLFDKLKKFAGIGAALAGINRGMSGLLSLSDQSISTKARVNMMVDDGEITKGLQDKIYASAMRSRADYMETANAAASLANNAGNAFNGNDEIIAFLEGVNKQFVIGGASAATQAGAMTQLSQAMAAGALRGDELNSVLEGAPQIARLIEKSMGWAEGSIKSYAEEGMVTAEVVKNAILGNIGTINEDFDSMPKTFAQAMTMLKNKAITAFQPLLNKINELVNNESFMSAATGILNVLSVTGQWAVDIIGRVGDAVAYVIDNWDRLSPAVYGATAVLGGCIAGMKAAKFATMAAGIATKVYSLIAVKSLGNWAKAILLSPAPWLLGIVAALGVGFGILANKVGGADVALEIVGASITDIWQNADLFAASVIQSVMGGFAKLKYNFQMAGVGIKETFTDIKTFALVTFNNMVDGIAKLLNKVFGTAYDANITISKNAALQAERDTNIKANNEKRAQFEAELNNTLGGYQLIYDEKALKYAQEQREREKKINDLYYERNFGGDENDFGSIDDLLKGYNASFGEMAGSLDEIAGNTDEIKNNTDIVDLIKDYHSRQATQKSTTQYITIDMSGQTNHISSSMELSTFTDGIFNTIKTAAAVSAEGV